MLDKQMADVVSRRAYTPVTEYETSIEQEHLPAQSPDRHAARGGNRGMTLDGVATRVSAPELMAGPPKTPPLQEKSKCMFALHVEALAHKFLSIHYCLKSAAVSPIQSITQTDHAGLANHRLPTTIAWSLNP